MTFKVGELPRTRPDFGLGYTGDEAPVRIALEPLRARDRLLRRASDVRISNPYDIPEMDPGLVTLTQDVANDTGLTRVYNASEANMDTFPLAWRGGFPYYNSGIVIRSSYVAAGDTYGNSAWAAETVFDGTKIQFVLRLLSGTSSVRFLVDEGDGARYVSKSFASLPSASYYWFSLEFPTRKVRKLRMEAYGTLRTIALRIGSTDGAWQPPAENAVLWLGDSYTQGTGSTAGLWQSWATIATKLLGWNNSWINGFGGDGYLANSGTVAQTFRQSLPILSNAAWDAVVIAGGINDGSFATADITAEAILTYQAVRTYTDAPIIVFGPWSGATGPSATNIGVEDAISTAVETCGVDNIVFIPVARNVPQAPIFGTGYVGSTNGSGNSDVQISADGVHPPDSGHELLARFARDTITAALETI